MFTNIDAMGKYVDKFETTIDEFGGISRGNKKYVFRKNVGSDAFKTGGAYFGCIAEGEDPSGAYSDLCIVVFPSDEPNDADDRWIISLAVGSLGYKNDFQIASLPGTRRMFVKYLEADSYVKNSFLDVDSEDSVKSYCDTIGDSLRNAIRSYYKVMLACTIFDPNDVSGGIALIRSYLAIYATLRNWPSNNAARTAAKAALKLKHVRVIDYESEIRFLLHSRKYVVLQGAPGTGKTYTAKNIVKDAKTSDVFFTQFHAETSYSDFVYGIYPDVNASELKYVEKKGVFVQAIERARELEQNPVTKDTPVYLIIDEINRANLANVLGQAFYLFEPTMAGGNVTVNICPGLELDKLPENLYVIATMNTADRSLAIVDFALRRRFAWYTLRPHRVTASEGYEFRTQEFSEIEDIFQKYATDEELDLQPGHAYFIVKEGTGADSLMKERLRYELMPLLKEYLLDGMLTRARTDLENYFRRELQEEMFR